jgi:HD-like signal output (HDOD) protein
MAPLFFWRRKKKIQPDAAAALAVTAIVEQPVRQAVAVQPVQRLVYALALNSPRAAEPAAGLDAGHEQVVLAARQTVDQVGAEPRYTPRRPSLLPQLMEAVNDEEASLRALSRMVMQDPRLTGEMLRLANSALYRVSPTPVESIERAAALLGTRGIRMLISGVLIQPLAYAGAGSDRFGNCIWDHSTYSSSAADAWAARSGDAEPFAAQMLALLHGLGVVTVYRVVMDIYAARPELKPDAAAIAMALEGGAPIAASRIARNWGLSDRSQQALEANVVTADAVDPSPLPRALQFGLLAGGLTLLCRHGRLTEFDAQDQLEAAGFHGPVAGRVWERLLRAYVRP